jgi:histidine triad (HIT) family protein
MNQQTCIFCKIIKGQLPSTVIAENDSIVVIKDRYPRAPIHYLILPKKHVVCVSDLQVSDASLAWELFSMAQTLAKKLPGSQAFNLIINNGAEAGQSVPHLHMHFLAQKNIYDAGGLTSL